MNQFFHSKLNIPFLIKYSTGLEIKTYNTLITTLIFPITFTLTILQKWKRCQKRSSKSLKLQQQLYETIDIRNFSQKRQYNDGTQNPELYEKFFFQPNNVNGILNMGILR